MHFQETTACGTFDPAWSAQDTGLGIPDEVAIQEALGGAIAVVQPVAGHARGRQMKMSASLLRRHRETAANKGFKQNVDP
jgi:hypothetical protein